MVNIMEIGNRIKELRTFKNLGFAEFAAIGGVSERSQRMYEGNKTPPTSEYCAAIAGKFKDLDMNWLLTGEGTMLKNGSGANDERFSEEDLQILRMIKRLPPTQKNYQVKNIEVFLQSADEYARHIIQTGELRMAA
jgi:transcriptional regulator with XRE-family HTH domain